MIQMKRRIESASPYDGNADGSEIPRISRAIDRENRFPLGKGRVLDNFEPFVAPVAHPGNRVDESRSRHSGQGAYARKKRLVKVKARCADGIPRIRKPDVHREHVFRQAAYV